MAADADRERGAHPTTVDGELHLGRVPHIVASHLVDQVAGLQAALGRRAASHDLHHEHPIHLGHSALIGAGVDLPGQLGGEGLEAHPDVGVASRTPLQDLGRDLAGHVDGDREAQTSPGGAANGGVDANHLAAVVDQGPATVAGIDGGIGLQIGHPLPLTEGIGPLDGTDDSSGHGVVKTQGIADGNGPLARLHLGGVPQGGHGQA